jgi:hypothetical protein
MVDREAGSDDEGATKSGEHQCGREEGRASAEDEDRESARGAQTFKCCNEDSVNVKRRNFIFLTVLEI